ncbi:hypothetical protein LSTR_LSTR014496 [Laodelphax striatellus]|uniref:Coilin n=2 Tax=Laodelphax striatellus TaxID=195883 RepID=A0A482XS12_LAOST|nr:hypothetical protein LSTR_LSTR014496 [Laodelphax striatellus]
MASTNLVIINLNELFTDHRKKCIIYMDNSFKTIEDIECYLKDKFQIEESFYLESSDVWIPSFSNIDILNSLDEVRLRLVQPEIEAEEKVEKKKKKKRSHSYEADNIGEDRNETSVKQKKKKKREDQIDTDVSSLTVEEDGKTTKKKKKKKDKDRDNGCSESEKVETSIPEDITELLEDAEFETPAASSSNILNNPSTSNDLTDETTNVQAESARPSDILSYPSASNVSTDEATNIQAESASSSNILNNSTISNDSAKRKRYRKRKKRSDKKNLALTDGVLEKAKQQAISIINPRLDYWQPKQQVAAKRIHIRFDDEEEEDEKEEEKEMSETEIPATSAPTISSEESRDLATSSMTANSSSNPPQSMSECTKNRYEKTTKVRKLHSSPSFSNVETTCSDEIVINNPSTSRAVGTRNDSNVIRTRNDSVMNTGILCQTPKGGYKVPVFYRKPFSNHTVLNSEGVDKPKTEITPISKPVLPITPGNILGNASNSGDKLQIDQARAEITPISKSVPPISPGNILENASNSRDELETESEIITDECLDSVAVSEETDNVNKNREDTVTNTEAIEEIFKTIAVIYVKIQKFQNEGDNVMDSESVEEILKFMSNIVSDLNKILLNETGTVLNCEAKRNILKNLTNIAMSDLIEKLVNEEHTVRNDEAMREISHLFLNLIRKLKLIPIRIETSNEESSNSQGVSENKADEEIGKEGNRGEEKENVEKEGNVESLKASDSVVGSGESDHMNENEDVQVVMKFRARTKTINSNIKEILKIIADIQKDADTVKSREAIRKISKTIAEISDAVQEIRNKGDTVQNGETINEILEIIANISNAIQKFRNEGDNVKNGEAIREILINIHNFISDLIEKMKLMLIQTETSNKESSNNREVSRHCDNKANEDDDRETLEGDALSNEAKIKNMIADILATIQRVQNVGECKTDGKEPSNMHEVSVNIADKDDGGEEGEKEEEEKGEKHEEEGGGKKGEEKLNEGDNKGNEERMDNEVEEKVTSVETVESRGSVRKNKKKKGKKESNYKKSATLAVFPLLYRPETTSRIPEAKPRPHIAVAIPEPDFSVGDVISFQVMYINSQAMPVATDVIMGQILSIKKKFKIEVLCGTVKIGAERTRLSNLEDGEDELKVYLPGSTVELFLNEMIGPKKVEKVLPKKQA